MSLRKAEALLMGVVHGSDAIVMGEEYDDNARDVEVALHSEGRLVVLNKPEPNYDPFPGLHNAKADVPDNTDRAVEVAESVRRWLTAMERLGEEE